MKTTDLLRELSNIDDEYINEAAPSPAVRSIRRYYVFAGLAAAAVIIIFSVRVFRQMGHLSSKSATAPASDIAMEASDEADEETAKSGSKSDDMADLNMAEDAVSGAAEESAVREAAEEATADAAAEEAATYDVAPQGNAPVDIAESEDEEIDLKDGYGDTESFRPELNKEKIAGGSAIHFRDTEPSEIERLMGHSFVIPEGASNVNYRMSGKDLAIADFIMNGSVCRLEMSRGISSEDLTDSAYKWDEGTKIQINGKEAMLYRSLLTENTSLCSWNDEGIMYRVIVSGDEDIEKLSEEVFN